MASDLPRSRAERRVSAMSLGATRTTRSPRRSRKRSSAPETWRQSSIAHTRSAPTARPQANRSSNDRRLALTVRSASTRPVAPSTAPTVCDCLWVSAPITIIRTVPSLGSLTNGSPADTSQSGRCHAPIRSRRGSSDGGGRHNIRRSDRLVDRKSIGQPVAGPRTYRPRRTPPPDPTTFSLRKSSRGGAPCRCGCLPVGDEPAVGGFGLFGELALAFAVGALAVGVLGRQGPASGVALGAGAQFEGADLLACQRRALEGVV